MLTVWVGSRILKNVASKLFHYLKETTIAILFGMLYKRP